MSDTEDSKESTDPSGERYIRADEE